LQSVLEWVASNKLVRNISKNKRIVFGTNEWMVWLLTKLRWLNYLVLP
jgi:hypothetical protein